MYFRIKLSRAEQYILDRILEFEQSVVTHYTFFRLIQAMYQDGKGLYLRHESPTAEDHYKYLRNMRKANVIRYDTDYQQRLIRVLDIAETATEDIICIADSLCYVSHLSAMHRWGISNRSPKALICTRPDRKTSTSQLSEMMKNHSDSLPLPPKRFHMKYISHPDTVRKRPIYMVESKKAGTSVNVPGTNVRIASLGQTFLDMLQQPQLCGGIPHVMEIYDKHAEFWLEEIVESVDSTKSSLVKSRAGYILEERLGLNHNKIESWKSLTQKGGSRKLDPSKSYASDFSKTWMLSLNA